MANEKLDIDVLKYYLDSSFALVNTKLDAMSQLYNERFSGLDARLKNLEDLSEDTSNHNLEDLENKLKEKKEDKVRWTNYVITFLGGVFITILAGVITLLTSLLMIYISSKYGTK